MKSYEGYVLQYVGDGSFLPGVPARDLSQDDINRCNYSESVLLDSGLYRKPSVTVTRAMRGGARNHSAIEEEESN